MQKRWMIPANAEKMRAKSPESANRVVRYFGAKRAIYHTALQ
jgi:hypothetical protein